MSPKAPDVDVARAVNMLARDDVTLLDVREDDEWAAGHVANARHIPLATSTQARSRGPGRWS